MGELGDVLIGTWRRLTFGGQGVPRFSEIGQRLNDQATMFRDMRSNLQELVDQYPARSEPLAMLAFVQLQDGEIDPALVTAEKLRQRFPGLAIGFAHGSAALRRLRRFDEAERLARSAMRRFPRNPSGFEAFAMVAQERGDAPAAAQRWAQAARRFPTSIWPQLWHARALAGLGQADAADAILYRAVATWPRDPSAWIFFADNAERLGDWAAAAERWTAMRKAMPGRPEVYARGARALRMAGTLGIAARVIRDGIFMFPRDQPVRDEHAAITAAGGDAGPMPDA